MKRFIPNRTITFTPYKPPEKATKSAPAAPENLYYFHPNHLGTGTLITNGAGEPHQYFVNLPYGETLYEKSQNFDYDNPYKFNGKELDQETGLYYYGARYYDPETSIWLSVDPLASERAWASPYNFVQENPLNRIDSDGQLDSPIYGTDGEFLGTDDQGLQGDMIVMDKENFHQGMAHEEAVKLDKGIGGFLNPDIANQALEHYEKLPGSRPDYDGIVTEEDADYWRENGNGQPLYVDISKINFKSSALTVDDLVLNETVQVNFFGIDIHLFDSNILWRPSSDNTLKWVYGTLRIRLLNAETGEIDLTRGFANDPNAFDRYDFNYLDGLFAPQGQGYNFYGYGLGKVKIQNRININPLGGYMGSKL